MPAGSGDDCAGVETCRHSDTRNVLVALSFGPVSGPVRDHQVGIDMPLSFGVPDSLTGTATGLLLSYHNSTGAILFTIHPYHCNLH